MMIKKIAMTVLLASSSSLTFASTTQCIQVAPPTDFFAQLFSFFNKDQSSCGSQGGSQGGPTAAPEIDPASAISGLTLFIGGIAVAVAGRRRQSQSAAPAAQA